MPILSESRFRMELSEQTCTASLGALKYAVALVSAAMSAPYRHHCKEIYALVRGYIGDCEADPDPLAFSNLNVFQALLFLVRYEIMSSHIARAWMTLGRATRLSSVLRLERLDSVEEPCDTVLGLHVSLPVVTDQTHSEERRRSFWLLYVWETYVKTRSGMAPQLGPVSVSSS